MSAGGYTTYLTGKWHVNAPAEKVFDVVSNVRAGMPKDTKEAYTRPVDGVPDAWRADDEKQGGYWAGGKHWSEVVADDAVNFLGQAKSGGKPAFFYIAFNAPHDPRQAPRKFLEQYPIDRMRLPENYLPEYPYKDEIGNGASLRDEKLAPHPRTEYAVKVHRREYYALVTHLDQQVGRILDELERLGLRDKTFIIFTSDHGLAVGHHGLMGKQNLFEHSMKVPFLVSGPGIQQGITVESPIYLQDIMPTTLDWAGIEVPETVDFCSLTSLLEGGSVKDKSIYGAYLSQQRSVTQDGWKLIVYPDVPKVLLFDLEEDPEEMTDLSEAHPERVVELSRELLRLQADLQDPLDISKAIPE
jgi:arylsulfatase A-like enzyme